MAPSQPLLYETQRHDAASVEKAANTLLKKSDKDLRAILRKHGVDEKAATRLRKQKISVRHKGAGLDPATVALAVSLVPLVKELKPILVPLAKSTAKVAEKIALDIWDMLRSKLWDEKHIRLNDHSTARKPSKKEKKNTKSRG